MCHLRNSARAGADDTALVGLVAGADHPSRHAHDRCGRYQGDLAQIHNHRPARRRLELLDQPRRQRVTQCRERCHDDHAVALFDVGLGRHRGRRIPARLLPVARRRAGWSPILTSTDGYRLSGTGRPGRCPTVRWVDDCEDLEPRRHAPPAGFVAAIDNGMGLQGFSAASRNIVTAIVLIAAVTIDAIARRGGAGVPE
jgi:hypothetical protein